MSLQSPNNQGPLIMFLSDGQEIFPYPQNGSVLPTASTAGLTAGVAIGYQYELPASDHRDEASLSLDFDYVLPATTVMALPVFVSSDPQYNFPPYQASTTQPPEAGEHPTIRVRDTRDHGDRKVHPKEKCTCALCKKVFKRIQELKRHQRETHGPSRKCPFCTFLWKRVDKIQHHIKTRHSDKFTAERLRKFEALRGKKKVEFLNGCFDYGLEVGMMPNIASLDFPDLTLPTLM